MHFTSLKPPCWCTIVNFIGTIKLVYYRKKRSLHNSFIDTTRQCTTLYHIIAPFTTHYIFHTSHTRIYDISPYSAPQLLHNTGNALHNPTMLCATHYMPHYITSTLNKTYSSRLAISRQKTPNNALLHFSPKRSPPSPTPPLKTAPHPSSLLPKPPPQPRSPWSCRQPPDTTSSSRFITRVYKRCTHAHTDTYAHPNAHLHARLHARTPTHTDRATKPSWLIDNNCNQLELSSSWKRWFY